jgi:K+/H+ antiporter YhaU regulatory subunit KhtT
MEKSSCSQEIPCSLTGRRERVEEFVQKHAGLKLIGHPREQEDFPISAAEMIEVVVPPRSEAVGKSLAELNLRAETGLTGVALWRDGSPLRTDVGTQTLQPGDALLLYGARENTRSFDPDPELLWYHKPRQEQAPRELRHLGKWAFLIMAAVIISAGLELGACGSGSSGWSSRHDADWGSKSSHCL